MKKNIFIRTSLVAVLLVSSLACKKDDTSTEENNGTTWTITVGAFSLSNGVYSPLGNELIFDSAEECQTWSRTAQGDAHDANEHLHYNAAADVSYDNGTTTFSWTEYGPEIDQASIEATCSNGNNGASKTVNDTDYYQDKPNVYLKITSVVEN
ncbi:MAG: hypothetical protein COA38_04595 [Fluviicola sp.]|nr:MAG: hypothetical protein COA38_04595 [Fluviicola sp.]